MGTRFVPLPDGRWTEAPDNLTDAQVLQEMGYSSPASDKKQTGVLGQLVGGVGDIVGALGTMGRDLPTSPLPIDIPGIAIGALRRYAPQVEAAGQNISQQYPLDYNSLSDIHGVGDAARFAGEVAMRSLPQAAVAMATGPAAPYVMGGLSGIENYAGSRQAQREQGRADEPAAKAAAYATAVPAGILDAEFGIGRILGGNVASNLLKSVGRAAVEEAIVNPVQDVLQRLGGYQEVLSPEAIKEYGFDAVAGAAAGGLVGAAAHPFGKMQERRRGALPAPDDLPPIPPDQPTDLLRLPNYSGAMYVTPQGDVTPNMGAAVQAMNQPHDYTQTPMPAGFEDVPLGTQTDLFNPNPVVASEPATQRAEDAGGQKPTQLPDPLQPSLFDEAPAAVTRSGFGPREVRMALTGGAKPDPFVFKVATTLTRAFADGNIDDARKSVDKEYERLTKANLQPATIDHRVQVLDRANNLIETYHSNFTDALAQEGAAKAQPGAVVGQAVGKEGAIAQTLEQNEKAKASEPALRKQLLDRALNTDGVRDPAGYYEALLKRNNLEPQITDDEFEHLYRTLETRDAEDKQLNEAAAKSGTAELEQHIPPARKADVAAALGAADEARANADKGITRAEKTAAKVESRQAEQKVLENTTPVSPKDALAEANRRYDEDALATMFYKGATGTELDTYDSKFATPEQREAFQAGKKFASGPQVTKVAPGKARGLEERSRATPIAHAPPVEEAGDLTQEQVEQQDAYRRIGDARAANHIDDSEQALLTNMLRKGAPVGTVKQAISDLVQKRKRAIRRANIAEKAGVKSPREAAIDRAEATPRRAGLPAQMATPEEAASLPQQRRLELTNGHIYRAARQGSFSGMIKAIADYHPNPVFRRVARAIFDAGIDVPVTMSELPDPNWSGVTYISDGHVEVVLAPDKGINPQTILHEGIHAFLISRLGMLSIEPSDGFITSLPDPVKEAMMDFLEAHDAMKEIYRNMPPEQANKPWVVESLKDLDEFAAYIPTDTGAQQYLATVGMDGKPLKRGQKSLWARLVDAVRRMLRLPPLPQTTMALEEILRTHLNLIDAAAAMPADMTHANEQIARESARQAKPMYTGERAEGDDRVAREANLKGAKVWEETGMPMEQIKLLTGWWKNPHDGKWRYEISDHDTAWDVDNWEGLPIAQPGDKNPPSLQLDEVLHHPKLYEYYPELARMSVVKQSAPFDVLGSMQGWYNEASNKLTLTPYVRDPLGTVLHEVQHVIQGIEGFARGGNAEMAANLLDENQLSELHDQALNKLADKLSQAEKDRTVFDRIVQLPQAEVYQKAHAESDRTWEKFKDTETRVGEPVSLTSRALGARPITQNDVLAAKETWLQAHRALGNARQELMLAAFGKAGFNELSGTEQLQWVTADAALTLPSRMSYQIERLDRQIADLRVKMDNLRYAEDNASIRRALRQEMGHQLYENIAGEMEARDVQHRIALTPEERRHQAPLTSEKPVNPRHVLVHYGEGYDSRSETRFAKPARVDTGATESGNTHTITTPVKVAQSVKDFTAGKSTRFAAVMSLGPKLAEMAVNAGVKSAATYQRLVSEREAKANQHETVLADLADRFDKLKSAVLKGRSKGSINSLAKRSVFEGKWAFQPDWLTDDKGRPLSVTVDPALHAEYMAMPPTARKIFEDGFRIPHELLHAQRKAVSDFIEGEHQRMIDAAQARYDAAVAQGAGKDALSRLAGEVRIARKSRDEDFKKFGRLFNLRLDEPYMPIRRFGDFVVVGRSREYLAEELAARETGETDKLESMKSDHNHYFVDFAPTTQAGELMARDLKRMFPQFNHDNGVEKFPKDVAREQLLGGRDMFQAFERLRKLINDSTTSGSKERASLDKMVTDMLLSTLVASSSRKAEMARLKVAGGNLDMMRGAISHGRGVAAFIAGIHKNSEILDALGKMNDEAQFQDGERDAAGREKRQSLVNELMQRHVLSIAPPPKNELADRALSLSSLWNILMSPSFFVQQAFQPVSMSVPVSAATHGWVPAMRELAVGYKRVSEAWKGTGLTTPLNLEQLPAEYRALATFLSERGRLDIGISKALGDWSSDGQGQLNDAMHNTMQKLGALTRKSEAINRLATALMDYNLNNRSGRDIEKIYDEGAYTSYLKDMREMHPDIDPMTERQFAAANQALKLIDDTHGTYDIASSPRWMRSTPMRILTQFKKFQIMQVQLYAQNLHDAFFGGEDVSREHKIAARRTLAFLVGHAAVLTGAFGLPGFAALRWLWEALMGDPDDPDNMEEDIRKAVGNPDIADLLIHGAPSLAKVNLTNSMGQGNILSPAPYTNFDLNTQPRDATDAAGQFVLKLSGPMIGGMGLKLWRAANFINNGDFYRGLETAAPRGIDGPLRAWREGTQGETTLSGNKTADVGLRESIYTALGLNPMERTRRQFVKDVFYDTSDAFANRALDLRQAYADAESPAEKAKVRQQWQELQKSRAERGFQRQPFSSLLRTERNQRHRLYGEGITYNRRTRRAAEAVQDEVNDE